MFCSNEGGTDSSLTAIITPVLDESVLRGLCPADAFWSDATARETPGRMAACLGRLVRCQS